MAEAGDIVWISFPFTAGVAIAALVPDGPVRYATASAVCMVTVAAMLQTCRKGTRNAAASILFFCLGALSMLSHEIAFTGTSSTPVWITGTMESLCKLIDSIGFEGPQTGALVKALLTGRKESLTAETVSLFRASGAAHLLALSGLHLGVLYAGATRLLSILGNSRTANAIRSAIAIAGSGFYMVMTGASASIVRAFLFITLNETLKHCPERRRDPLRVLCSALLIQLTFNPAVIRSSGFQLSYLAMLGIYTIYPSIDWLYPQSFRFDVPRKIWSSAALSLSCQCLTAPLVWFKFKTFPKFFLITNIIALPLSELFIIASVACLAASGAGWCPDIMKSPVEIIARTLLFCLETISTM